MQPTLHLSSSPHVFHGDSTAKIMWTVVAALLPAAGWGVFAFGPRAGWVIALAVGASMACEAAAQKLRGRPITVTDGSACLTGLLLALNLPASSPWWLVVLGAVIAIGLGKHVFGGLGQNPFNPALVARVALLVSFPVQMTTWATGGGGLLGDAVTAATPLGLAKTAAAAGTPVGQVVADSDVWHLALGFQGGCIGEVSALALLAGAAWLLWSKAITWDIPLAFVATTLAVCSVPWSVSPDQFLSPVLHLVTGGLVLGAFFMATDMVTSPLTARGRWIFGAGCGLLTAVIRLWGGYPEGVSFAILLMNACVPLIDRFTRPRKFGVVRAATAAKGGAA
ncbi:MAG: RnfABCDGE type electron transport complex subunit D [Deferrisomatales bacterium]|nr:RnfABCDGE type electron transport complex subunit D [Deferrisomatales bacterium]